MKNTPNSKNFQLFVLEKDNKENVHTCTDTNLRRKKLTFQTNVSNFLLLLLLTRNKTILIRRKRKREGEKRRNATTDRGKGRFRVPSLNNKIKTCTPLSSLDPWPTRSIRDSNKLISCSLEGGREATWASVRGRGIVVRKRFSFLFYPPSPLAGCLFPLKRFLIRTL